MPFQLKEFCGLYLTFATTYVLTGFYCFLQDKKRTKFDSKIQLKSKWDIIHNYRKAIGLVSKNVFVTVPLFFLMFNIICSILFGSMISTHLFNIWDIPKYMLNFILVDIFFYLGHRLFHIGFLYKKYHKKHHEFTKPVSIIALYTHPIDCICTNIFPVLLPIIILREGLIVSHLWIITAVVNTIYMSHNGEKDISDFHDLHHEQFNYNYGTEVFMDKLLGTYKKR